MDFKFIKELVDEVVDENTKNEFTKSKEKVKKEYKNLKVEIEKAKNPIKKEEKKQPRLTKYQKRRKKLKEDIGIINCFLFFIFIIIVIFAFDAFYKNKIVYGILAIISIPTTICIEITFCLKYTKMTLKEHLKFAEKKYGKTIENFLFYTFIIAAVIFIVWFLKLAISKQ